MTYAAFDQDQICIQLDAATFSSLGRPTQVQKIVSLI